MHEIKQAGFDFPVRKSLVLNLLEAGFPITNDRFLRDWVTSVLHRITKTLRTKARIHVPKGILLMGIMDESFSLPWNQVFFQSRDRPQKVPRAKTTVAVGRNPCVHPGDIRLLQMADIQVFPWHQDLYDVLVFSAKGPFPQVIMMSGGDFDGDLYFAIWDLTIVDYAQEQPPMKYASVVTQGLASSSAVTTTQATNFFLDFMRNDNIGQISNAHAAFADASGLGARSSKCTRLAELHSIAVDFCKTGVPARLPCDLIAQSYPHFMEKNSKQSHRPH